MPPSDGTATDPLADAAAISAPEAQLNVAHVPAEHRRRLGQYVTPPRIAAWMAGWILQPSTQTVLDPAVGTGALLGPILAHPLLPPFAAVDAWEIDPVVLDACRHTLANASRPLTLHCGDFLSAEPTVSYDAIVCNPPYVRHRTIHGRQALYGALEQALGVRLSRFSNSYVLFILKIAMLLSPRGRAAILTPVDFLSANFGSPIKSFLLRENVLDGIVVFDKTTLVFDDANIAACLVLLHRGRAPAAPIQLVRVPTEAELAPLDALPAHWRSSYTPAALPPEAKWLPMAPSHASAPALIPQRRAVPLGQLADVRRGIATGANEFFTLTAAECERFGLLPECRPCVVKASYARRLQFGTTDFEALSRDGAKVYLLDLPAEVSEAARAYLDQGLRRGVHERYLTRHRSPWYATEQRRAAPLWVTTFSRNSFRFVLNDAGAANLTAFHALYPHVCDREWLLTLAALLNSAVGLATLAQHQRLYGSGLGKLEPLDVARLPVIDPGCLRASVRAEIAALYMARCCSERWDAAEAARCAAELNRKWAELVPAP